MLNKNVDLSVKIDYFLHKDYVNSKVKQFLDTSHCKVKKYLYSLILSKKYVKYFKRL